MVKGMARDGDGRRGGRGSARRRIQWLAGFVVLLAAAYTGLWFFLAGRLDDGAEAALVEARAQGTEIECAGRDVRGYPFRLGLACDAVALQSANGAAVEAGAFRSAAQIYRPGLVVSELDGPLTLDAPGASLNAEWDLARASTRFGTERLNLGTLEVDDVAATLEGPNGPVTLAIARILASARPNGADLDASVTMDGLDVGPVAGRDAPPVNLFLDATLSDAAGALSYDNRPVESLRGRNVTLRDLDLAIVEGGRVEVGGAFAVDADGLATGEIEVAIVDLPAIIDTLSQIAPEAADTLRTIEGVLSGAGGGAAEGLLASILGGGDDTEGAPPETEGNETSGDSPRRITLVLDRGRIRLGVIPVGSLPPLP